MRGVELELRNRLEESQRHVSDSQKRLRYWQEKLEKLTLHSLRFVIPHTLLLLDLSTDDKIATWVKICQNQA